MLIFRFEAEDENLEIEIEEESISESLGSGFLVIETIPGDAELYLDGTYQGRSPLILNNIPVGLHNIVIRKDAYEYFTRDLTIEAGKKTYIEVPLILEEIEDEFEVEEIEEEKEVLVANGKINIGKNFLLYYDFSEVKFEGNRQLDSDIFSKRFKEHIVFTRFDPTNIKVIDKGIEDVNREDCSDIKGQYEFLYSRQSLCIITKENEIIALGGSWDNTEDVLLTWKLFS